MPWLLILLFLSGCSGYRYTQQDNPLSQYGIESISVPMFYNYSNQPGVSHNFTRETFRLLSSYQGLKVKSGYHKNTDAVLIGIVKSPEQIYETLNPINYVVAQGKANDALGEVRQDFYIPGITDILMGLQIIIIKKPTEEELSLLRSGLGDKVKLTSRIIVNETIPLRQQFTREIFDDEEVNVISTHNAGIRRKTMITLSEEAAIWIRDMILYAF